MTASVTTYGTISVHDLAAKCKRGERFDLIDVRTPAEFREVHAAHARNAPLDSLDASRLSEERRGKPDEPLYVVCRTGSRAAKACDALLKAGAANVVLVDGGTVAWEAAGLPVIRGKKTISLERQVRIAAGSIVLTGTLLAWLVHPAFLGLTAFVGGGLIFAGVSDWCGMGMLLAKAPWNQAGKAPESKSAAGESCKTT